MSEEKKAEPKETKKKEKGGKKRHKNNPTSQKWKMYKIQEDKITRERSCPRCGPGVFLMKANDRVHCGKCSYTEFFSKK